MNDNPSTTEPRPPLGRLARIEVAALALTIACGLVAWASGIRTLRYDYDEVQRAHSAWLASRGLRPYDDFFEVHPPYFALLTPMVRGRAGAVEILQALRGFAAAGNLIWLAGLGFLGASLVEQGRRWAWLGLAAVAFDPAILEFLVEFRIDGWGYALAAWAFYRHRRLADRPYRAFELGAVTGVATLFFCPKLTILPGLVVALGMLRQWRSPRRAAQEAAAYAGGVGVAAGLFASFLAWQGIDFGRMTQLLVRYHAVSIPNAGFGHGLARAILGQPKLASIVLAGLVAWAVDRARRRAWPGAYESAVLTWLAAQAFAVAYPYKQYFAPWFLFAAGYLGYLGQQASAWLDRARLVPFLAACVATGVGAARTAQDWAERDQGAGQARLMRWIDRVAGPDDRVVASPPLHPVDRLDAFFVWFNTADPNGFDSEKILARLPAYRERVTPGAFLRELEAHPPAVVALSGDWQLVPYTAGQSAALAGFFPRHGYRIITVGPAQFAIRPDRLAAALRAE